MRMRIPWLFAAHLFQPVNCKPDCLCHVLEAASSTHVRSSSSRDVGFSQHTATELNGHFACINGNALSLINFSCSFVILRRRSSDDWLTPGGGASAPGSATSVSSLIVPFEMASRIWLSF